MLGLFRHALALIALTSVLAACGGGSASRATQPGSQIAAATATPSPSAAAKPPGTTTETVDVDGVRRSAIVYVPANRGTGGATPVILVLHGAGGSGAMAAERFQLNAEADRLGFIAVYPDGTRGDVAGNTNWNDGRPIWGTGQPPDDVGFIRKLLDRLIAEYAADPRRISVAGFSSGGMMAARLACELSDRVAAVAIVSGPRDDSACALQRPLSILVIHGTADSTVPYTGGLDRLGFPAPAEADVVAFWRTHDGCAAAGSTRQVTPTVGLQAYTSCKGGNEVRFYTVQDGGHSWPSAPDPSRFAASPAIAEFLLAHPREK